MYRPVEIFLGLRYLRSRSRNRFVSFISLISVLGIALSVAVLIVVLSVMNGFEYEVRQRILSVISHASISGTDGSLEDWRLLTDIATENSSVVSAAPYVSGQGMLVGLEGIAGVEVRGVEPLAEERTTDVAALMRSGSFGSLEAEAYRVLLGETLATRLGVGVGDKVVLMLPVGTVTPAGLLPRMRRFEVAGLFYAGMYEYDRSLAYVHYADAARLWRLGDAVSGLSLAVTDPMQAGNIVREVAMAYGGGVYVSDWTRQYANFFRSIELTKAIIFFILLLVVAVAAFNIVSTLVMVVREKSAEIAILRSMGSSSLSVLWVFMTQGTFIGMAGTFIGVGAGAVLAVNLGAIVAWIEGLLGFSFVAADVYFISELPSRLEWGDVAVICTVALVLASVATVYPALRAAATNPAEALRHD